MISNQGYWDRLIIDLIRDLTFGKIRRKWPNPIRIFKIRKRRAHEFDLSSYSSKHKTIAFICFH